MSYYTAAYRAAPKPNSRWREAAVDKLLREIELKSIRGSWSPVVRGWQNCGIGSRRLKPYLSALRHSSALLMRI